MAGPLKKTRTPVIIPRSFGSPVPAAGKGGFGGFATATSKSGLAYLAERYDPSAVSDANAVVAFKNLFKKDSTTKARALEELLAYAHAHPYEQDGGAEEAVLSAWVHFYPRLSIDESRKVRELAHTLQFELMKSARRRMEKHTPQIVGPWLAGTYDRDRGVAKAAADGLASFLTTDERALLFWKRLQVQILEFATEALQETPTTLSDMRSSSKEDADLKYHRVVYSGLSLVLALLEKLDAADTEKARDAYEAFFAVEAVWKSAVSSDSHVRRAAYRLYGHCLETHSAYLEAQLPRLTKLMTREAPKTSQVGSVGDYVRVLTLLTKAHPETWSGGKHHPFTSLRPLVEAGSQGTPSTASSVNFWLQLDALFAAIPGRAISQGAAFEVLASFRAGVSRRDEPRSNAVDAWTAYLSMVKRLVDVVDPADGRVALVEAGVYPLLDHYLSVSGSAPASAASASSPWTTGAHTSVLTRACLLCSRPAYPDIVQSFRDKWTALSADFAGRIANSLPEVSKEFQKSQQTLAGDGDRWMALVAEIHAFVQLRARPAPGAPAAATNLAEDVVERPTLALLESAVAILTKRNYKPFGAAQLLSAAFATAPHILVADGLKIVQALFPIGSDAEDRLSLLLASPSAPQLLSCLRSMASIPGVGAQFDTLFGAIVSRLLQRKDSEPEETSRCIELLVADAPPVVRTVSQHSDALQSYLSEVFLGTAKGNLQAWDLVDTVLESDLLAPSLAQSLSQSLVGYLEPGLDINKKSVLAALDKVATIAPQYLQGDNARTTTLVEGLLRWTESDDVAVSAEAVALHKLVVGTLLWDEAPQFEILNRNLNNADQFSLQIDSLLKQVVVMADSLSREQKQDFFPSTVVWMEAMLPFMQDRQPGGLGGLSLLVLPRDTKNSLTAQHKRDLRGHAIPARIADYTLKLLDLRKGPLSVDLPEAYLVGLLYGLFLVLTLGEDQIDQTDANSFWGDLSDGKVLSSANTTIRKTSELLDWLMAGLDPAFKRVLVDTMLRQTRQISPLGLATAQALTAVLRANVRRHNLSLQDIAIAEGLDLWKTAASYPATVLGAVAVLQGYAIQLDQSKTISVFCNRLVSDVAGAKAGDVERTLATLVQLNACLAVYDDLGKLPVASNRLVFAVKQITSWFGDEAEMPPALDDRIAAESCRALVRLLPAISDVYGPHWERSLRFCIGLWTRAARSHDGTTVQQACVYWSLRLVELLEALEDPNDDLTDALASLSPAKTQGLLALCQLPPTSGHSLQKTQAQRTSGGLLCRMVSALPLTHIPDVSDLYSLVASASRDVQTAGFSLLHRALPAQQEEYSLEVILEKKEGRLPNELLSLLLDAPTLDAFPDDVLATFPTPVRTYLLSWHLVFDAMAAASAKVRGHYAAHLGEGQHVAAFLAFAVDVLGHSAAHPLLLDREQLDASHVRAYAIEDDADTAPERDMHWLLVHLYYEVLRFVPGQFKAWYAECRSKQTKVAVEAWTARWISELLVQDVLDEVEAWGQEQEEEEAGGNGNDDGEETQLAIKVSRAAREVIAGYAVEDMEASIAIRLPANYPIDAVTVAGINRVAVSERKWQSWLMITQGVIAFSNGSVVEGLATFRRNVVGALRGQSECAICYSIISADKKMPDKRCGTCRNLFHRTCLYKWFQTSNQNTCPLCRNPISFLGADSRVRRGGPEE